MEQNQDETNLKDIVLTLKRAKGQLMAKRRLLLICVFLGGITGITVQHLRKTTYTANLIFAFSESQDGKGNLVGLASQFGVNLGDDGAGFFQGDNLVELMKSRNLVEKTLYNKVEVGGKKDFLVNHIIAQEFDVSENPEDKIHDVWFEDSTRFFLGDSFLGVYHEYIIENSCLTISKKDDELAFVEVSFTSENDTIAKLFTENLVKEATAYYSAIKMRRFNNSMSSLNLKIDSVGKEMKKNFSYAASKLDQASLLIRTAPRVSQLTNQKEAEMQATIYAELIKSRELQQAQMLRDQPLVEVIDEPIYPLEENKPSKLIGLLAGGFLFGFITCAWILFRPWWNELIQE